MLVPGLDQVDARVRRTSDDLDLSNAVRVTEDNTDLRGGGALLRELADLATGQ